MISANGGWEADFAAALVLTAAFDLDETAFFVLDCAVDMEQCVLSVGCRYVYA